jgi:hypothetical protein
MTAESNKVQYRHALSMWWLLLWRSFLGLFLLSFPMVWMLKIALEGPSLLDPPPWRRVVATIIWIGILVLAVFAAQLIVQQMLWKRYRRFALSVIDIRNGEARPNNHLSLLERFKVVWALFWRFVPIAGIVYYLCRSHLNPLPALVTPLTQLFRLGFFAGLVFLSPFAVLFALRRRYRTFTVCLTEPAGKARS